MKPANKSTTTELAASEEAWMLTPKGIALCNLARLMSGSEDFGTFINPALRLLNAGAVAFEPTTGDLVVSQ